MEFGGRVKRKEPDTQVADIKTSISHVERHVKLIRIAWKQGKEDNLEVNRGKHVCRFYDNCKLCLFLIYVLYVPLEKESCRNISNFRRNTSNGTKNVSDCWIDMLFYCIWSRIHSNLSTWEKEIVCCGLQLDVCISGIRVRWLNSVHVLQVLIFSVLISLWGLMSNITILNLNFETWNQ